MWDPNRSTQLCLPNSYMQFCSNCSWSWGSVEAGWLEYIDGEGVRRGPQISMLGRISSMAALWSPTLHSEPLTRSSVNELAESWAP